MVILVILVVCVVELERTSATEIWSATCAIPKKGVVCRGVAKWITVYGHFSGVCCKLSIGYGRFSGVSSI